VNTLLKLTKGEFTSDGYMKQTQRQESPVAAFIPFLIFLIFAIIFGRARRRAYTASGRGGSSLPFWLLMGSMGSRGHSGHWDNFSGGGGSFGGGGGFGGFGGGSFGGGGAGGSW